MKLAHLRPSARMLPVLASLGVLILLYTGGCLAFENFGSLRVLINLFGDNAGDRNNERLAFRFCQDWQER